MPQISLELFDFINVWGFEFDASTVFIWKQTGREINYFLLFLLLVHPRIYTPPYIPVPSVYIRPRTIRVQLPPSSGPSYISTLPGWLPSSRSLTMNPLPYPCRTSKNAHLTFSSALRPRDVTLREHRNSRKSMNPFWFLSNVRNTWPANSEASPDRKKFV